MARVTLLRRMVEGGREVEGVAFDLGRGGGGGEGWEEFGEEVEHCGCW
jgi:hypothetical protein